MIIVFISLWYSRSGAFLSLRERGSPGIKDAHIIKRVSPRHGRPGWLERREAIGDQLSLDGVGGLVGLDRHRFRLLAVAMDGVAGFQALALALRNPGIGHHELALVAEHHAVRARVMK